VDRSEHLAWAKRRAVAFLDRGEVLQAWTSFGSDLAKHPELASHPALRTGTARRLNGDLSTVEEMRAWIEGFG